MSKMYNEDHIITRKDNTMIITLETYAQTELLEEKDYDNYLTQFTISEKNLQTCLKEIDMKFNEFMETWTYDMSEQVYDIAKENGYIISECLILE